MRVSAAGQQGVGRLESGQVLHFFSLRDGLPQTSVQFVQLISELVHQLLSGAVFLLHLRQGQIALLLRLVVEASRRVAAWQHWRASYKVGLRNVRRLLRLLEKEVAASLEQL